MDEDFGSDSLAGTREANDPKEVVALDDKEFGKF